MRGVGLGGVDKHIEALIVAHGADPELGADGFLAGAEGTRGALSEVQ